MAILDVLARKAYEKGQTPEDIAKATKSHAGLSLLWCIVAGIAWYISGMTWALVTGVFALIYGIQSIGYFLIKPRFNMIYEIEHGKELVRINRIIADAYDEEGMLKVDDVVPEKIEAPNGKEITPKKMVVITEGMKKSGGSIRKVSKEMNRTVSNTHQHIQQCKSMYGFDYKIDGDRFWILKP